jgi:hypothetical protein
LLPHEAGDDAAATWFHVAAEALDIGLARLPELVDEAPEVLVGLGPPRLARGR